MYKFLIVFYETCAQFAPYLIFGFLLSAFLRCILKPDMIQKLLGERSFKSVFWASIIGVPLPLCSCSVIPVAVSLSKNGASDGATTSFITSTPVTGVDSIALSFAMLPTPLAIIRPIAAFSLGLLAGFVQLLSGDELDKQKDKSEVQQKTLTWKESIKESFEYLFFDLFPSLSQALIIGILIAAFLNMQGEHMSLKNALTGIPLLDMVIVVALGVPVYICATGSTPVAASLIGMGLSPGLALVFLLTGPATNTTTITTMFSLFKLKGTVLYLISIIVGSIGFGLFVDTYFLTESIEMMPHKHHVDEISIGVHIVTAVLLLWFVLDMARKIKYRFFYKKNLHEGHNHDIDEFSDKSKAFLVEQMTCQNCENKIHKILEKDLELKEYKIDLASKVVFLFLDDSEKLASIQLNMRFGGFEMKEK